MKKELNNKRVIGIYGIGYLADDAQRSINKLVEELAKAKAPQPVKVDEATTAAAPKMRDAAIALLNKLANMNARMFAHGQEANEREALKRAVEAATGKDFDEELFVDRSDDSDFLDECDRNVAERLVWMEAENARMRQALEKLSRLGNGDLPGNSDGNLIAQAALNPTRESL